jgi:hypothetical protein
VGAPFPGMDWMKGKAYLYDGASGALLQTFQADQAGDGTGIAVAGAGDVNGDGVADVAIGAPFHTLNGIPFGQVTIRSGASGQVIRAFTTADHSTSFAWSVAGVGDVNGDGLGDVLVGAPAVGSNDHGAAFVYLGADNNQLGFGSAMNAGTSGKTLDFVASADVDGDGLSDAISVSTSADKIGVHRSNNDGSPGAATFLAAGNAPSSVAAGDFDDDGDLDLAVASASTKNIIFFRNGGGDFVNVGTIKMGAKSASIISADFNHDGHMDLAMTHQTTDKVSILINLGVGTSGIHNRFKPAVSYKVKDKPGHLAAGDLNGDQYPDLVVADRGSNQVSVLLSQFNGTFASQQVLAANASPISVVLADFDADGIDDLAWLDAAGDISTRINVGNGTFQPPGQFAAGQSPKALVALDIDYDGYADLATANAGDDTVSAFLNNQNGGFDEGWSVSTGADPKWIAVGDADGDGDNDIITANHNGKTLTNLLSLWFN